MVIIYDYIPAYRGSGSKTVVKGAFMVIVYGYIPA